MPESVVSSRNNITPVYPSFALEDAEYSFAIIADPQLGNKNPSTTNSRSLYNYQQYDRIIKKINREQPAFVVINGDLVEKPRADLFNNFLNLTAAIESPVLLVHGNHDGKPPFTLFLDAQARVSGFQSLYYSFDVGGWHYVVLPAFPEQIPEEIAPQMLAWLAADMEANQFKNTMVFTHFPYMPQGLTQLEYYVQNPLELRLQILDELLKYGNTKYWFAGHVHNGIQNSVKTAWEYRGAKFITVPTVVRPRNFGEEYPTFREGLGKGGYQGYFILMKALIC